MKIKLLACAALLSLALTACDETTDTIGTSLTENVDNLEISTGVFDVVTRSIIADSVYSRNAIGYLGRIKDPETGAYITSDYMTQFHCVDDTELPTSEADIVSREDGKIIAESCEVRLFLQGFYGDSLATMKLAALEMSKPLEENQKYYSNFDPEAEGYIRTDGIHKNQIYTLANRYDSDEDRARKSYGRNITVHLNEPYTDKDGNTYNNLGTYILRKYYENPERFKNSYEFIHNIFPGFYIKCEAGLGAMAYIEVSQLNVNLKINKDGETKDMLFKLNGTEEVLQTTRITNDDSTIKKLVDDQSCTYLKSPAGIFTEMTLPVDAIVNNHPNDTLSTAKIVLTRLSNESHTGYELDVPNTLLMIPADSLYTFFEKNNLPDNKTSFITTRDTKGTSKQYLNTYTFSNISHLITVMAEAKEKGGASFVATHPNWNKVVIVPISTIYSSQVSGGSTVQVLTKVAHNMSLSSTRLVGGSSVSDKLQLKVIYTRFKNN